MEIVNIGKVVALFCNVDKILYTLLYDLCECDKGQGHKDKEDNFWCHVFLSLATLQNLRPTRQGLDDEMICD
jgi:hypothetical protein